MSNTKQQIQVWQQAVAATEAFLLTKGYNAKKAHAVALKRNRTLHPAAQIALKRNLYLAYGYKHEPQLQGK